MYLKYENLIGKKFNKLLVQEKTDKRKRRSIVWKCVCDCGNIAEVTTNNLTSNHTQSCGCLHKYDLVGQRFGELIVLSLSDNTKFGTQHWHCKCDCGNDTELATSLLTGQIVKTCGCLRRLKGREKENYRGYKLISGRLWNTIKRGAKIRKLEFNLNIEDVWNMFEKQNRKCSLSGLNITLVRNNRIDDETASLDRIDSSKGYIIENVQWLHKDINIMKLDHTVEKFIKLCRLVSEKDKYEK